MTEPAMPSTPSGPPQSATKATDHELPKHDKFTRYGHNQHQLQRDLDESNTAYAPPFPFATMRGGIPASPRLKVCLSVCSA
mgnify:CR=1 FL=1